MQDFWAVASANKKNISGMWGKNLLLRLSGIFMITEICSRQGRDNYADWDL